MKTFTEFTGELTESKKPTIEQRTYGAILNHVNNGDIDSALDHARKHISNSTAQRETVAKIRAHDDALTSVKNKHSLHDSERNSLTRGKPSTEQRVKDSMHKLHSAIHHAGSTHRDLVSHLESKLK